MPQLTVLTNVTRENVPKNFTQRATQIMVAEIKKDAKVCDIAARGGSSRQNTLIKGGDGNIFFEIGCLWLL